MTDQEIVAHHFDHSDSNQDGELDSREWLGYLRQEDPNLKRDRSTRMLRWIYIGVGGDFFFLLYILFFPNECPGMCQHRPGHSLEKTSSAMIKSAWFFIFQKYGKYRRIFRNNSSTYKYLFLKGVVEVGDFNRNLCPILTALLMYD